MPLCGKKKGESSSKRGKRSAQVGPEAFSFESACESVDAYRRLSSADGTGPLRTLRDNRLRVSGTKEIPPADGVDRRSLWLTSLEARYTCGGIPEFDGSEGVQDERVILVDVPRTLPSQAPDADITVSVLRAVSRSRPDVGYCQGMSYLCLIALHITGTQPQRSHEILLRLLDGPLEGVFSTPHMAAVTEDGDTFRNLLISRLPDVAAKLDAAGAFPALYVPRWFLAGFAQTLPSYPGPVLSLWDAVVVEGKRALFAAGLAVCHVKRKEIVGLSKGVDAGTAAKKLHELRPKELPAFWKAFYAELLDEDWRLPTKL